MSSAVNDLQRAIVDGQQPIIQLLRHTKLIAAKLNLSDIEKWVDLELNGYPLNDANAVIADYRCVHAHGLAIHNPYRGWQYAGDINRSVELWQPIAEIEELSRQEECFYTPNEKFTITDSLRTTSKSRWPQRLTISPSEFKGVLEAVRNELLQWAINLEKRGIKGENMSFNEREKQSATNQTFHINKFTGILGNVHNSQVTLYDYGTIQQLLIDHEIPKAERRELEDIMDELKVAEPEKKLSLIERAEKWILRHKEILGLASEAVAKAVGTIVAGQ